MAGTEARAGSPRAAVTRYLARQFGRPTGAAGRLAGWIMATRPSNRRRNDWTVGLLGIRPGQRVLEIGYGPGLALGVAARLAYPGVVVGVDHSQAMHAQARRRHAALVAAGRLDLRVGRVEDPDLLPAGDRYDRIFAVNAVMFWDDPEHTIRLLAGRLAPGGRMAFTFQPRLGAQTDEAALAAGGRMHRWMAAAGLVDLRLERLRSLSPMAVCALGQQPGRQPGEPGTA